MPDASEKRLRIVHPILAKRVRSLIAALALAENMEVRVVQGLRTYAEQDMLYAQGRTRKGPIVTKARGGYSNHNFGLACDLCPFVKGRPLWDDAYAFKRIGLFAQRRGLVWGGSWVHFPDTPHVELPGPTLAKCRELFKSGGLVKVWEAVPNGGLDNA